MTERTNEFYLGDGLYASFDGCDTFWLRAPRCGRDHEVALDPHVLEAFEGYVKATRDRIAAARAARVAEQRLEDAPEADDGIDHYALSNGLGTVMPDGTRIPAADEEDAT